jgi:hypothetical protein
MVKIFLLACMIVPLTVLSQSGPGGVSNAAGTLELWLDSKRVNADGTNPTVGATVTTWSDQSGNGRSVTQNTADVATYSATGVTFNNTGYLTGSDAGFPTGTNARTVIVCASSPSTNADDVFFVYGNLTQQNSQCYGILKIMSSDGTAPNGVRNFLFGNDYNVANGWTPAGTLKIVSATYQSNTQSISLNNAAATTRTPAPAANTTLGGATGIQVGGWTNFTLNSQATIAEIIFHSAVLDAAELIIVNNYLAAKHGLTLAANDLYDNDNAGNGNYDFDVAGIGQAAAAAQNLSAQGSIVRIYNPTDLGNGEYYIWGHDNAALTPVTTNIPAGVQARLSRIWRGSETGAITNFEVSFDLTGLGPIVATDLRLLIDIDGDGLFSDETVGTGGIVSGATSLGANVYEFANVTALNNDVRFTLASANTSTTPLPVKLVSFEAMPMKSQILLTWQTATETNNEYFDVQRSTNGTVWEDLVRVSGAGNSTTLLKYETADPLPYNGTSYYRLKQVDYDGTFEYSPVKAVDFIYGNTLFPNPTTGIITLTSGDDVLELSNVSVISSFGRIVNDKVSVKQLSTNQLQIDMSLLPAGIYLVRTQGSSSLVHKQ